MRRFPKQPKMLRGFLTFKLQNGTTERCLVESKSKKGVDGLMREVVRLIDGFYDSTELIALEKFDAKLFYEGYGEERIQSELNLVVKTICEALGLVR
jgi:hypothetical protein